MSAVYRSYSVFYVAQLLTPLGCIRIGEGPMNGPSDPTSLQELYRPEPSDSARSITFCRSLRAISHPAVMSDR